MSTEELVQATAFNDSLHILGNKVEIWKRDRRNTIKELNKVAKKHDSDYRVNNGVKLGGAIASAIGGLGLVLLTGGAATPLVVAGGIAFAAAGAAGGVSVVVADYKNESANRTCKEEAEKICKGEVDSYEEVIDEFKKIGHHLQNKLGMKDWLELGKLLVDVLGLRETDLPNKFLIAIVMGDGLKEFEAAIEAAEQAIKAAEMATMIAKKAAQLAKRAEFPEEAAKIMERAEKAEKAAKAVKEAENAWSPETMVNAVKDASDASKEVFEAVNSLSNVMSSSGLWKRIQIRSTIETVKQLSKEAELVADAAEAAAKIATPLARGAKILGKVLIALSPIFVILDVNDAVNARVALQSGESPAGHYVRKKAKQLEDEIEQVDEVYKSLHAVFMQPVVKQQ